MLQQAIRVIQWQLTGLYHQHHWLEVLKVKVKSLSHVRLLATPWTIAYQAPPSTGVFQARVPEWGAIAFSRGSSQPRDRTMVSCITGRCFTIWATREVPKWKWTSLSQSCPTLCDPRDYNPWNALGQNTGVGISSLLQGIFPTQGSNPRLLHCRWILYQLSHKWSPGGAEAPVKWNVSNPAAKNPTKRYKRHEAGTEVSVF